MAMAACAIGWATGTFAQMLPKTTNSSPRSSPPNHRRDRIGEAFALHGPAKRTCGAVQPAARPGGNQKMQGLLGARGHQVVDLEALARKRTNHYRFPQTPKEAEPKVSKTTWAGHPAVVASASRRPT